MPVFLSAIKRAALGLGFVLAFAAAAGALAPEVQLVTRSNKVIRGKLIELTDSYARIRDGQSVTRVRLGHLSPESARMLQEIPPEVVAELADEPPPPEPAEQEKEKIDFAALNYSDWKVGASRYLSKTHEDMDKMAGILARELLKTMVPSKGRTAETVQDDLIAGQWRVQYDKRTLPHVPPATLEDYHKIVVSVYDSVIELYELALDGKTNEVKAGIPGILKAVKAALEEELKACEKVSAPEEVRDAVREDIAAAQKRVEEFEQK